MKLVARNTLIALMFVICAAELRAEPIPDRFGLAIHCINTVYERVRTAAGIKEEWELVILPAGRHKACVLNGKVLFSYKFIRTLHHTDELACVMGHEFAHIKLGHLESLKHGNTVEADADYLGYIYAKQAGYNPDVCEFLTKNDFPVERIHQVRLLLAKR
ncbi:MAG: M48 family metalloprotease [Candidatus Brocadiales bacterium]